MRTQVPPAPPEFAAEAGRARLYALLGGAALKFVELLLRRADKKRDMNLEETGATLRAGAQLREELRKENESLREREIELEQRIEALEVETQELENEIVVLKRKLKETEESLRDAEAEIRMLKRAQRSPIPPSRPPEEGH